MTSSRLLLSATLSLALATMACSSDSDDPAPGGNGSGGASGKGGSGAGTGGSSAGTGGSSAGTGGSSVGTGGSSSGTGGSTGSGGSATGGSTGSGGATGTGGSAGTDAGGGNEAAPPASGDVAGQLHGAYLELTCAARIEQKFCQAKAGEADQKIMLKFGGDAGKMYDVVLKVWGVVEQQTFRMGMPLGEHMQVGGTEATVGNTNYSVYGLIVGETSYWLNRYPTAGGDKTVAMHYTTPTLKIPGGANLVLRHFDKNNHMTRNFDMLSVPEPTAGLLTKIKKQPFDGSFLYIEVVSATPAM